MISDCNDCSPQLFSHSQHFGDSCSGDETHFIWGTKELFLHLCFQVNILHAFNIFTARAKWVNKPLCLWGFSSHLWLVISCSKLLPHFILQFTENVWLISQQEWGSSVTSCLGTALWNNEGHKCIWISARKSSWLNRICLFLMLIWKVCRAECWNKNHDDANCETSQYSLSELKDVFMVMRISCSHTCYLFWTRHYEGPGRDRSERRTGLISK
jgi:hypothetical protein